MSDRTLKIHINSGKTTCAAAPGEFCQYLATIKFGTTYVCALFPSPDQMFTVLNRDINGWLQRCQACLDAELPDPEAELG